MPCDLMRIISLWYGHIYARYPGLVLSVTFSISLALTLWGILGTPLPTFQDPTEGFVTRDNAIMDKVQTFRHLSQSVGRGQLLYRFPDQDQTRFAPLPAQSNQRAETDRSSKELVMRKRKKRRKGLFRESTRQSRSLISAQFLSKQKESTPVRSSDNGTDSSDGSRKMAFCNRASLTPQFTDLALLVFKSDDLIHPMTLKWLDTFEQRLFAYIAEHNVFRIKQHCLRNGRGRCCRPWHLGSIAANLARINAKLPINSAPHHSLNRSDLNSKQNHEHSETLKNAKSEDHVTADKLRSTLAQCAPFKSDIVACYDPMTHSTQARRRTCKAKLPKLCRQPAVFWLMHHILENGLMFGGEKENTEDTTNDGNSKHSHKFTPTIDPLLQSSLPTSEATITISVPTKMPNQSPERTAVPGYTLMLLPFAQSAQLAESTPQRQYPTKSRSPNYHHSENSIKKDHKLEESNADNEESIRRRRRTKSITADSKQYVFGTSVQNFDSNKGVEPSLSLFDDFETSLTARRNHLSNSLPGLKHTQYQASSRRKHSNSNKQYYANPNLQPFAHDETVTARQRRQANYSYQNPTESEKIFVDWITVVNQIVVETNEALSEIKGEELTPETPKMTFAALKFGIRDAQFQHYIMADAVFGALAFGLVFLAMWLYTGSVLFTVATLLGISLSVGVAHWIYRVALGLQFFPFLNLLAIVLVLGIGADDALVLRQIWLACRDQPTPVQLVPASEVNRSSQDGADECSPPLYCGIGVGDEENGMARRSAARSLARLVSRTVSQASLSMTLTSVTTIAALLSTVIATPVVALRCFGLFAILCVAVNYAFIFLSLPAVLSFLEASEFSNSSNCFCGQASLCPCQPGNAPPNTDQNWRRMCLLQCCTRSDQPPISQTVVASPTTDPATASPFSSPASEHEATRRRSRNQPCFCSHCASTRGTYECDEPGYIASSPPVARAGITYGPRCGTLASIRQVVAAYYEAAAIWGRVTFEKLLPCLVIKLRWVWLLAGVGATLAAAFAVGHTPGLHLPSLPHFLLFSGGPSHPLEAWHAPPVRLRSRFSAFHMDMGAQIGIPIRVVWGIQSEPVYRARSDPLACESTIMSRSNSTTDDCVSEANAQHNGNSFYNYFLPPDATRFQPDVIASVRLQQRSKPESSLLLLNGNLRSNGTAKLVPKQTKMDFWSPSDSLSLLWLHEFCSRLALAEFTDYTPGHSLMLRHCFVPEFLSWMERPCIDPVTRENRSPCCANFSFPFSSNVAEECLYEAAAGTARSPALRSQRGFLPLTGPLFLHGTRQVVALVVEFDAKLTYSDMTSYAAVSAWYTRVSKWIQKQLDAAPETMRHAWFTSDLEFFALQTALASGTHLALWSSLGIAFLIVIIATRGGIGISLGCIVAIGSIIIVTIGFLAACLRWELLNVLESTILILCVGLSFDYTIHYVVAYQHFGVLPSLPARPGHHDLTMDGPSQPGLAPSFIRQLKLTAALSLVGEPVAMSAFTTFLAGLAMLPASTLAYTQIGAFMMVITAVSWLISTLVFTSYLYTWGPLGGTGGCCSIMGYIFNILSRWTGGHAYDEAKRSVENAEKLRQATQKWQAGREVSREDQRFPRYDTTRLVPGRQTAESQRRCLSEVHFQTPTNSSVTASAFVHSVPRQVSLQCIKNLGAVDAPLDGNPTGLLQSPSLPSHTCQHHPPLGSRFHLINPYSTVTTFPAEPVRYPQHQAVWLQQPIWARNRRYPQTSGASASRGLFDSAQQSFFQHRYIDARTQQNIPCTGSLKRPLAPQSSGSAQGSMYRLGSSRRDNTNSNSTSSRHSNNNVVPATMSSSTTSNSNPMQTVMPTSLRPEPAALSPDSCFQHTPVCRSLSEPVRPVSRPSSGLFSTLAGLPKHRRLIADAGAEPRPPSWDLTWGGYKVSGLDASTPYDLGAFRRYRPSSSLRYPSRRQQYCFQQQYNPLFSVSLFHRPKATALFRQNSANHSVTMSSLQQHQRCPIKSSLSHYSASTNRLNRLCLRSTGMPDDYSGPMPFQKPSWASSLKSSLKRASGRLSLKRKPTTDSKKKHSGSKKSRADSKSTKRRNRFSRHGKDSSTLRPTADPIVSAREIFSDPDSQTALAFIDDDNGANNNNAAASVLEPRKKRWSPLPAGNGAGYRQLRSGKDGSGSVPYLSKQCQPDSDNEEEPPTMITTDGLSSSLAQPHDPSSRGSLLAHLSEQLSAEARARNYRYSSEQDERPPAAGQLTQRSPSPQQSIGTGSQRRGSVGAPTVHHAESVESDAAGRDVIGIISAEF